MRTFESIYKSIVQPYFDYCSPFWDTCERLLKDKLQIFQTRATRVLSGANYDTHSVDLLNMLSWNKLQNRRSGAKSVKSLLDDDICRVNYNAPIVRHTDTIVMTHRHNVMGEGLMGRNAPILI